MTSLRDIAEQVTAGLAAQQEAWLLDQARVRGLTAHQLAESHAVEIGPPQWRRDESTGAMRIEQSLRLIPKSAG